MKPTRDQIKSIILYYGEQENIVMGLQNIIHKMSPDIYPPCITVFNSLKVLDILFPDIYTCVSYRLYDCSCFDNNTGKVKRLDEEISVVHGDIDSLKEYLLREDLIVL